MKLWLWFCFPVICSGELLPSGTQAPWRQGFCLCGSLVYPEGFAGEPGIPSVLRRAFLRKDRSRQHPERSAIRHRSDKTRWAVLRSCSVFFPSLPRQPLKSWKISPVSQTIHHTTALPWQRWSPLSVAATANYHKPGGWTRQKWVLSQFWEPEEPNQGVGRAARPPKALRKQSSPLLSLMGSGGSWQSFEHLALPLHHASPCLPLHTAFPSFGKDICPWT